MDKIIKMFMVGWLLSIPIFIGLSIVGVVPDAVLLATFGMVWGILFSVVLSLIVIGL